MSLIDAELMQDALENLELNPPAEFFDQALWDQPLPVD